MAKRSKKISVEEQKPSTPAPNLSQLFSKYKDIIKEKAIPTFNEFIHEQDISKPEDAN